MVTSDKRDPDNNFNAVRLCPSINSVSLETILTQLSLDQYL